MLCALLTGTTCWARSLSIEFDKKDFHIDSSLKIIVCAHKYRDPLGTHDSVFAVFDQKFRFVDVPESLLSDTSYILKDSLGVSYELFFTQLPLVSIHAEKGIMDEQVPGQVVIHDTSDLIVKSFIGMELRGGSSRSWPKKKFEIQFWVDSLGEYIWEPPLFGMRSDKDWIFEAMYNEPMRIRSFTNWQIWRKTHSIHYAHIEKDAKAFVNGVYVEVFLNGHYQGVYALTEKMDRKQLKLKKSETTVMEGELYKGFTWGEANQYLSVPSYDNGFGEWGGYEIKYPNELRLINWEKIHDFTDFVVNSSDEKFMNEVNGRFLISNAVDYMLFLNLMTAYDNSAKNLFTAKYDKTSPYFYVPWDMDATWGIFWDGGLHGYTNVFSSNRFFDRLLSIPELNFRAQLEERWAALRQGPWEKDALEALFLANRNILLSNNVYKREQLAWPTFAYSDEQFVFLQSFMQNRIKFLDAYFHYEDVLVTSVEDVEAKTQLSSISPNPASTEFRIYHEEPFMDEIDIVDMAGKVVQHTVLQGNTGTIDVRALTTGMYLVKYKNEVHKLFVQKAP